ncbi:ribosomal N-lysine methyltransferase [Penicillium majusculum]|nr:ribosomal N-lysine methyltransferase [Penicillium majusculum]
MGLRPANFLDAAGEIMLNVPMSTIPTIGSIANEFADYLNHTDNAPFDVTFDGEMYTFKAKAHHEKGDEIFMSYGSHHNDCF